MANSLSDIYAKTIIHLSYAEITAMLHNKFPAYNSIAA